MNNYAIYVPEVVHFKYTVEAESYEEALQKVFGEYGNSMYEDLPNKIDHEGYDTDNSTTLFEDNKASWDLYTWIVINEDTGIEKTAKELGISTSMSNVLGKSYYDGE